MGPVSARGTLTVRPSRTTLFRLGVHSLGGSDAREVNVRVFDVPDGAVPLAESIAHPSAGCDASAVWVTVQVPAERWDPHLRVATVSAPDRPLRIEHGARSVELAAGGASSELEGAAVAGPWLLRAPLTAGEACRASLPPSLRMALTLRCTR